MITNSNAYSTNLFIRPVKSPTVKLGSLNWPLNVVEGIRAKRPAELDTFTTLPFCRKRGNKVSHTCNVDK